MAAWTLRRPLVSPLVQAATLGAERCQIGSVSLRVIWAMSRAREGPLGCNGHQSGVTQALRIALARCC